MNLNVANCPICGDVFQKNFRNMCMKCSSESDDKLNRCIKYLYRNSKSTTEELSEALDISTATIIKFIKKGLIPKAFPNLTYPCDSCASPIKSDRLCSKCLTAFRGLAKELATPKPQFGTGTFRISDRLRS